MSLSRRHVSAAFGAILLALLATTAGRLHGRTPQQASTPGAAPGQPTYTRDVAPILYKHCTACHRPGEIAPMSLLTYQEARPWARAIRTYVLAGVMPPWHADPAYGKWLNERRLTTSEKDTIVRWVDAGAPQGDPKDLPKAPDHLRGWSMGQPDAVVSIAEFPIPARGEIPYQYFQIQTNLTEDKWIQALEIRPGNRAVVHHVLVYARSEHMMRHASVFSDQNPPGPSKPPSKARETDDTQNSQFAQTRRAFGWLMQQVRPSFDRGPETRGVLIAQIAPGRTPIVFARDTAMLLQAGTILTFQVHYTTNGTATTDKTSIGFKFTKQAPMHELRVHAMQNGRFMIPPGAANHPVEARLGITDDITLYSIAPHTHLRGKSWEYTLIHPDGHSEVILAVPKYDFNWQTDYAFAVPLRVPKGSTLKSIAHYDNSRQNKANPDPTQPVYYGDQTWEEMQYTGLLYSVDKEARTTTARRR